MVRLALGPEGALEASANAIAILPDNMASLQAATSIATSTYYLLLVVVVVFSDRVSAHVFICDGEVSPLAVHMTAQAQWPICWPVQRACARKQAVEIRDKVIAACRLASLLCAA